MGKDNQVECRFYWIIFSVFVGAGAYSVCAPILPLELAKKGITGAQIGGIFAFYSVGCIVWPPVVCKYLIPRVGQMNLIGLGLGFMGLTFVCFGFLEMLENRVYINLLAFTLRLLQGISCATGITTCLFIFSTEPPVKK